MADWPDWVPRHPDLWVLRDDKALNRVDGYTAEWIESQRKYHQIGRNGHEQAKELRRGRARAPGDGRQMARDCRCLNYSEESRRDWRKERTNGLW
jgi:hypothetical protein